jgi:acetoin utilization protein AcuC
VHEQGRWPGTGQEHLSHSLNFPVRRGFDDADLDELLVQSVLPELAKFNPQAIVITCGADALAGDPLSSMQVSNTALWRAVKSATDMAPRAVVLGGGGYNPWTTVRCWSGLWGYLNDEPMPEWLPDEIRGIFRRFDCDLVDDDDRKPEWFERLDDLPVFERPKGREEHAIAE